MDGSGLRARLGALEFLANGLDAGAASTLDGGGTATNLLVIYSSCYIRRRHGNTYPKLGLMPASILPETAFTFLMMTEREADFLQLPQAR